MFVRDLILKISICLLAQQIDTFWGRVRKKVSCNDTTLKLYKVTQNFAFFVYSFSLSLFKISVSLKQFGNGKFKKSLCKKLSEFQDK